MKVFGYIDDLLIWFFISSSIWDVIVKMIVSFIVLYFMIGGLLKLRYGK